MNIKIIIIFILLIVFLMYFILSRTRLAKNFMMSETIFYFMNIIGIVFGTLGLIVTFGWPQLIFEKHYFELILLPIFLVYIYTAIIMKARRESDIYDEKQIQNMTQAAAVSWVISIIAVFFLYLMYKEAILTGLVFFPIYFYFSIVIYSASLLFFFKKY